MGRRTVSRSAALSEQKALEQEDPEREAGEHAGAPVTAAEQGRITRAEADAMAPLVPAPGWAGEIKLGVEDTWEPTIAADPNAPYVYVMYNRFGGPTACKRCPFTPMYVRVSADNGVELGAGDIPLSMRGREVPVRPGRARWPRTAWSTPPG